MSQEQWYLLVGEDRIGPLTTSDLKARAGGGELHPRDLVWKYGLTDWTPAAEFEYLFPAGAAAATEAAPTPAAPPPDTSPDTSPDASPDASPGEEAAGETAAGRLANPGLRVAAAAIDLAILSVPVAVALAISMSVIPDFDQALQEREGLVQLIMTVVLWTYFATQECAPRQGTFGKRMLGLKVTDLAGQPISFARASARHFARAFFFIGFLLALFSERRQALHDVVTGCVVLHEPEGS